MRAASIYARLGWRVVPLHSVLNGACSCAKGATCKSPGKHPRLNDWVQEATTDAEQIGEWQAQWPTANLGIATGTESGVFCFDVDSKNGGLETLAALEAEHGELPATAQAATPSGGRHYVFKMPPFPVGNRTHVFPGIDVRGDGGQFVAAPSLTSAPYRWVRPPFAEGSVLEAPAWLLAELRRAPAVPTTDYKQAERGYFPAASPAVLEAARASLLKHGGAIQGHGGDLHTFRAAALLVHDFALTEAEAWPLLQEWNEELCEPEWSEPDLRAKLRGGGKYGSADYGCRRTMDALEQGRKLIADWRGTGKDPAELVANARKLRFESDPQRTQFAREITEATGWPNRDLKLPKAIPPPVDLAPGEIMVTTEIAEVADRATSAIAPHVFQRNGVLCEVVTGQRTFISDLEVARVQDLMSQNATFKRKDENQGTVIQAAPAPIATLIHARRSHLGVRVLDSITTAPVFLADGTILQDRGYNEQARVFLEPSVEVAVPEHPTLDDARRSVRLFWNLLSDFKFADRADFASWLAALLSPLCKTAINNAPVPLFCVSASSPGAGKTLLTQVLSAIVMGVDPGVYPYNPRDPSEWGKRLTAFVKAASPITVFDNVNGPFGDESIDRLVTSSTWTDRLLGASEAPPLPNVTTWLATGNNIEPVNDTVRRVLMVRIEVDTERPQERSGFKIGNLHQYALEHRSELLGAALTILRAYHVAGRPTQSLAPWGSFTAWSELVRAAIVWTGFVDPFETQRRASSDLNEPENEAHDFWITVLEETPDGSPQAIVELCAKRDAQGVLGMRDAISTHNLKKFVGRFIDKPRGQKRIRRSRDQRGVVRYYVEQV